MSFGGFDLWIGYRYLQRAGIRHVEVPALPMSLGAKFDLTTFAPEAMDQDDINLLKQRLRKVHRRGKFILFELDRDRIAVNAMLTGRFQLASPGDRNPPNTAVICSK